MKKRWIVFLIVIILIVGFLFYKNFSKKSEVYVLPGTNLGFFPVHNASNSTDWNSIDISDCSIVNTSSILVSGIWLGPWDGLYKRTLAPDTNAAYSEVFLPVLSSEEFGEAHFELKAEFPEARFMSYHLYNEKFILEGNSHLTDYQFVPDVGSVNPFVSGYPIPSEKNKTYTMKLIDYNKINYSSKENVFVGGYLASGEKVKHHSLMIRYYDPKRENGKMPGLVGFPRVLFKYKNSDPITEEIKNNPCKLINYSWYEGVSGLLKSDSSAEERVSKFIARAGKISYPGYLPSNNSNYSKPQWVYGGNMVCTAGYVLPEGLGGWAIDVFSEKAFAGKTPEEFMKDGQCGPEFGRGAFNYDNRYIFSFLDAKRGSTVMRMKSFESAKYGDKMLDGNRDLRYWSICVLQPENLMWTYSCARDDELVKDSSSSYVTFIFTKINERPEWACDTANATGVGKFEGCKYNWFPYVSPAHWLYIRTLDGNKNSSNYKYLPITFNLTQEANGNPNDFVALKKHMGEYYPDGEYCEFNSIDETISDCDMVLKNL